MAVERRRLAMWLLLAAALLFVAELALRLLVGLGDPPLAEPDEATEYRLVPSASYTRFGNRIEINRYGMRGIDHAPEAGTNERRIMLVGDSVVYGGHEIDQAQTIAARMTSRMQVDPRLNGCSIVVMPAAVSSWGPVNEAAFLERTGLLDADLGVVLVSAHDLYDVPRRGGGTIPYRQTAPFGALGDALEVAVERLADDRDLGPHNLSREDRQRASLAALDAMSARFQRAGSPMLLAYHATLVERGVGRSEQRNVFNRWAGQGRTDFLDLSETPLSAEDYLDTIHPSESGAERIAQALARRASPLLEPCS